jgi:hypothetical protein
MRWRSAAAVAALGLLTGCASVPTHSAAHVVENNPSQLHSGPPLQYDVRPEPGASQSIVVSLFLQSFQSWQNGHDSSRSFMTGRASRAWQDDDDQIVVSADSPEVGQVSSDNVVPVTFRPVGVVAKGGSYRPAVGAAARPRVWRLKLIKTPEGEWRIDKPPPDPGVVLSSKEFGLYYAPHTVYFLDPSGSRLVPDVRYLPIDPDSLVSRLVQLVTAGPSDWLAPVVTSDLGPVRLNRIDIDPVQHLVRVDLSGLNAQVNDVRQGAVAQLVGTLGAVAVPSTGSGALYSVQVTSDGQRVDLPDAHSTVLTLADLASYDPEVLPDVSAGTASAPGRRSPVDQGKVETYYVHGGAVFTLEGKRVSDARHHLSAVGVSTDLDNLAGVGPRPDGHGVTLWLGKLAGGPLRASKLTASTLSRPTWDRATGSFWVVADGRYLRRVSMDGGVHPVQLGGSVRGPVGALRLARDGTRVAFVAGVEGHRQVYVARVRSDAGSINVEQPLPVAAGLADVSDLAWAQPALLEVLGVSRGQLMAWRVNTDGFVSADGLTVQTGEAVPAGTTTITAAPGRSLAIGGSLGGGTISVNQGNAWNSPGKGVVHGAAPTFPG